MRSALENLDELYGNDELRKRLKNIVIEFKKNNSVCPSFQNLLFSGPSNSGKFSIALLFSKLLIKTQDEQQNNQSKLWQRNVTILKGTTLNSYGFPFRPLTGNHLISRESFLVNLRSLQSQVSDGIKVLIVKNFELLTPQDQNLISCLADPFGTYSTFNRDVSKKVLFMDNRQFKNASCDENRSSTRADFLITILLLNNHTVINFSGYQNFYHFHCFPVNSSDILQVLSNLQNEEKEKFVIDEKVKRAKKTQEMFDETKNMIEQKVEVIEKKKRIEKENNLVDNNLNNKASSSIFDFRNVSNVGNREQEHRLLLLLQDSAMISAITLGSIHGSKKAFMLHSLLEGRNMFSKEKIKEKTANVFTLLFNMLIYKDKEKTCFILCELLQNFNAQDILQQLYHCTLLFVCNTSLFFTLAGFMCNKYSGSYAGNVEEKKDPLAQLSQLYSIVETLITETSNIAPSPVSLFALLHSFFFHQR